MATLNKVKNLGQIYTPVHIVNDMLDLAGYQGKDILQKHIIDNSCGNGAFLVRVIERYIEAYEQQNGSLIDIEKDLKKYIHGIEIDKNEWLSCINNLDNLIFWKGIGKVDWDIINADTLEVNKFDGQMDYVVANPPYVRVHNLKENFEKVREYNFAQSGMTDLFIVFYEIGFRMLNRTGKLVYITPNSFYMSAAGQDFRNFIIEGKNLYALVDLGHYQPFKATTYTTICAFDVSKQCDNFSYSLYAPTGNIEYQDNLILKDAFNNGKMILAKKREQGILKDIQNYTPKNKNKVQVKNAFATLADDIYIKEKFSFESSEIIDILKASTGEWKKCIFPYDNKYKPLDFDQLSDSVKNYFNEFQTQLKNRSLEKNSPWYVFGRSQAISDVGKTKIAVNTTVKDINSIKINQVGKGIGVYSGLYIVTDEPYDKITKHIKSQEFLDYIKTIGKCKSGGYYTFSSYDLKQYLYYKIGA